MKLPRASTRGGLLRIPAQWHKVLRELSIYRTRTALAVLSIAVGVFVIGTIAGTHTVLHAALDRSFQAGRPASALLRLSPFDDSLANVVERMPEVAGVAARRTTSVQFERRSGVWERLDLTFVRDAERQTVELVLPETGTFPPRRGELFLERSTLAMTGRSVGDVLLVRTPAGDDHELVIAGTVHTPTRAPGFYVGHPVAFIDARTAADIGLPTGYDDLWIRVAEHDRDVDHIADVVEAVRERVASAGETTVYSQIPVPGRSPTSNVVDGLFLVLGALGTLSLLAGGMLVANTVAAIVMQQRRQIGVLKAIGARAHQIAAIYVGLATAYGVGGLLVGVPLAALGSYALTSFTAGLVNVEQIDFSLPPDVLALQVAVGLLVPLGAAALPVIAAIRLTAHDAIASAALDPSSGASPIDRALRRVTWFPRPVLLAMRNTFRPKLRLTLTLAALVLGSSAFIAVFSVRGALERTLEDVLAATRFDAQLSLATPGPDARLARTALAVPGVTIAEGWLLHRAQRLRTNDARSPVYLVSGVPVPSEILHPTLRAGRWLTPTDTNAIVVTSNVLDDEPDLTIGSTVTLEIAGRDADWQVVGIAEPLGAAPALYVPLDQLQTAQAMPGVITDVFIRIRADAEGRQLATADVRNRFEDVGQPVRTSLTVDQVRTRNEQFFFVLLTFLGVVALLVGASGAIGLAGTMTMNVTERAREIGILRAVGASGSSIAMLFVNEAVLIGFLSWAGAAVLSAPIGRSLSDALGETFLRRPLSPEASPIGPAAALAAAIVLAIAASLLPAWRAARLSVREALTYE